MSAWSAEVQGVRAVSPLAPACWLDCPDWSGYSLCKPVHDFWSVYLKLLQFVPLDYKARIAQDLS